jgi:hypothetical protein
MTPPCELLTDIEPHWHWHALVVWLLMGQLELSPFRGGMWGDVPMRDPLPVSALRWAHCSVSNMVN